MTAYATERKAANLSIVSNVGSVQLVRELAPRKAPKLDMDFNRRRPTVLRISLTICSLKAVALSSFNSL